MMRNYPPSPRATVVKKFRPASGDDPETHHLRKAYGRQEVPRYVCRTRELSLSKPERFSGAQARLLHSELRTTVEKEHKMKRWTYFALACVAAVSIACGDRNQNQNAGTRGTEGAAGTAGAANIDRDFIQDQLGDGTAKVELSRLAQQRATHPQVKEFAEMMVRDHERAVTSLKEIATKYNIPIDRGEQSEHNDLRERLSKLSGPDFDREYIKAMIEEHDETGKELERKANDENPEIRQWATNTLPTVRQHLERAPQIEKSLEQR